MICEICNEELTSTWTDTSCVCQCVRCGTAYRTVHFDKHRKRVDKPPEIQLQKDWIFIYRQYYTENKKPVRNGFNVPGSPRDFVSNDDQQTLYDWVEKNHPEMLKEAAT